MLLFIVSILLSLMIVGFGVVQGKKWFGAYDDTGFAITELAERLGSCAEGVSFKRVLAGWVKHEDPIPRRLAHSLGRLFEKEPMMLHGQLGWVVDLDTLCDGKRWFRAHEGFGRLEAMPGILTGAGILFTFLGLTVGVFGLDPTDAASLTSGVKKLLGGMSMAFLTSISGIGTGLWWSWQQKIVTWKFETAFAALSDALEDKPFLLIPDEMNYQLLDLQSEQAAAMERMEETMLNAFRTALRETGMHHLKGLSSLSSLGDGIEAIRSDLAVLSEGRVQRDEINKRMLHALTHLVKQGKQASQTLDNQAISEMREVLAGAGDLHRFQGSAVGNIREASEEMMNLIKSTRQANEDMLMAHKTIAVHVKKLEECWQVYRNQMESMQTTLNGTIEGFGKEMQNSLSNIHGEFDEVLAKTMTHFTHAMKEFEGTLEGLTAIANNDMSEKGKSSWLGKRK